MHPSTLLAILTAATLSPLAVLSAPNPYRPDQWAGYRALPSGGMTPRVPANPELASLVSAYIAKHHHRTATSTRVTSSSTSTSARATTGSRAEAETTPTGAAVVAGPTSSAN